MERAIRESDLGLNPQTDGDLIRVPIPPLSEERRKELVKVAKKDGEECKVAIRKSRHEALDMLTEIKEARRRERGRRRPSEEEGRGVHGRGRAIHRSARCSEGKEILTL